jgi:LPXTG-site transpeptidase (sortase) family protein
MVGLDDARKVGAWTAWTLILVGAVLVGASLGTKVMLASAAERSLQAFEQVHQERVVSAANGGAAAAPSSDPADTRDPLEGVLRIPALNLRVPVYEGTDELSLSRGAGRVDWTPPLGPVGNVGIAAHRDGAFATLQSIAIGDEVFIDWRGGTLRYEVVNAQVVKPTDVHVLDPTTVPGVTLVTCYPLHFVGPAPLRFIVHATLSDGGPAASLVL